MRKGGFSLQQKRIANVDFAQLRMESGAALATNGNRLTLILACMIATSPLMLYTSALSLLRLGVLPLLPNAQPMGFFMGAVIVLLLSQFITLPLWAGLLRVASQMEQGQDADLTQLFYAFCNGSNYKAAQGIAFSILWRLSLLALLEGLAVIFIQRLFAETVGVILWGVPLYLAVFAVWFLIAIRGFFIPYLAWKDSETSLRVSPYSASVGRHYWLGFFPWIVLSLLTFGVLLLADTLPRMLIAYFRLCNKLNEFTTQSEEMIK